MLPIPPSCIFLTRDVDRVFSRTSFVHTRESSEPISWRSSARKFRTCRSDSDLERSCTTEEYHSEDRSSAAKDPSNRSSLCSCANPKTADGQNNELIETFWAAQRL